MATTKITITLPDRQLAEIRKRVRNGESQSVSGFVKRAVEASLDDSAEFLAMLDEALERTGGPPTPKERAWARSVIEGRKHRSRSRKAA
jgi:Arc/MetJ-type ribon-helix-helix transcriptional regulator